MKTHSKLNRKCNYTVSIISCLFLICVCVWSVNMISYAAEETSGEWAYTYTADGATITEYNGNDSVVEIPSSINGHKVIAIDPYVFQDNNMTQLVIPETIGSIGYEAFYNCRNLSKIEFNAKNCSDCSDSNTFYNAGSETGSIEVTFGPEVKKIPACLFYVNSDTNYARISTIVISDSIQNVGSRAFRNCFDLQKVTWGNSIKEFGEYSFENCIKLEDVTISESVTSIGYEAFYNCRNLSKISYNAINCSECSDSNTFYNAGADSDSLQVEFGSNVKTIPSYLFRVDKDYNYGDGEYAHVTSVKMSDSILDIGRSAFHNCFDLQKVTWGNSIKEFGEYSFENCIKLEDVAIPKSVTSIGYEAFYNCRNLSKVSYNAINCSECSDSNTFYNAGADSDSLQVEFGPNVKTIPSYLFRVDKDYNYGDGQYAHITSVKMSNSILNIGVDSFSNCFDLNNITWGNSIEIIGSYAFENCISISSISLPKTVKTIDYAAFRDCSGLKKAVIKSKKAEFESDVFKNCHKDLKIYCYRGSTALEYAKKNDIKYSYLDLAPVSISSVTNKGSGVKIAWKKVSGATGYYVYRKTKDTSYKKIKTIEGGDKLNYTDTSVKDKNGSTYYYTVKAYSSSKSSSTYTTKKIIRLKGISISELQNKSGKKMYVSWGKNSKASGYQIQYSTSSKFSNAKSVTVSGYKNVSKTISKLTKGKKYYVRVRAYKKSGDVKYYSAWSSSKSIKISK